MTSVMLAAFGSCLLFIACCRRLLAHRRRTRAAAAALRLAQELNTSSRLGRMDAVTALLALGAQPSWREDTLGLTALHMAAVGGHCDILETLLRAGAPLETLCDEGRSPLACAVANGQAGAVDTLLRAGASVRAGTSVRLDAALQLPQGTRSSRTAAECIVRSLLAAGLPVDLRAAPPHNSPLLGALLRQPHLLLAALEGPHVRCLELNPAALSAASGRAVTAGHGAARVRRRGPRPTKPAPHSDGVWGGREVATVEIYGGPGPLDRPCLLDRPRLLTGRAKPCLFDQPCLF